MSSDRQEERTRQARARAGQGVDSAISHGLVLPARRERGGPDDQHARAVRGRRETRRRRFRTTVGTPEALQDLKTARMAATQARDAAPTRLDPASDPLARHAARFAEHRIGISPLSIRSATEDRRQHRPGRPAGLDPDHPLRDVAGVPLSRRPVRSPRASPSDGVSSGPRSAIGGRGTKDASKHGGGGARDGPRRPGVVLCHPATFGIPPPEPQRAGGVTARGDPAWTRRPLGRRAGPNGMIGPQGPGRRAGAPRPPVA